MYNVQVACAETENAIHFSRLARVFMLYHFKIWKLGVNDNINDADSKFLFLFYMLHKIELHIRNQRS